jgi:hypothetical protein
LARGGANIGAGGTDMAAWQAWRQAGKISGAGGINGIK